MLRRLGDDASYSHVRLTPSLHLSPSLPLAQTHKHTDTHADERFGGFFLATPLGAAAPPRRVS